MARGKHTCRILKDIRRQIAEANNIELITSECRYKGDCPGTCPKCEAEIRYLEQQLYKRQLMGKAVVVAGVSAGVLGLTGCNSCETQTIDGSDILQGEPMELLEKNVRQDLKETDSMHIKEGEIASSNESVSQGSSRRQGAQVKTVRCPATFTEQDTSHTVSTRDTLSNAVFGEIMEIQPAFPGGAVALSQFIEENLRYPQTEACAQGKVVVRFMVDKTGNVCHPEIMRSNLPEEFSQEALRVVGLLPRFRPGAIGSQPVEMRMYVPVIFRLK
ncbi:MAG: energy transducer TonB [Bacteroidales bacterium]|nr:energy transducer TonB [Bacteroidales bacterium]MCM1146252.1 energy transducer TonB [Bacteroidales bacterium]MCM1205310.1 energy transducer TonB [Bacillota bacterium]MCM1509603.1 energy transducer TonB [Clostridium sp.]